MPADRTCTPPPPLATHREFGAAVRVPDARLPTLPSDRELDAIEARFAARELDVLAVVARIEWEKRELATRESVPVRRAGRSGR